MNVHINRDWRVFINMKPWYWSFGYCVIYRERVGFCLRALCFGLFELQHWRVQGE